MGRPGDGGVEGPRREAAEGAVLFQQLPPRRRPLVLLRETRSNIVMMLAEVVALGVGVDEVVLQESRLELRNLLAHVAVER